MIIIREFNSESAKTKRALGTKTFVVARLLKKILYLIIENKLNSFISQTSGLVTIKYTLVHSEFIYVRLFQGILGH